jgi:hypothetical protein
VERRGFEPPVLFGLFPLGKAAEEVPFSAIICRPIAPKNRSGGADRLAYVVHPGDSLVGFGGASRPCAMKPFMSVGGSAAKWCSPTGLEPERLALIAVLRKMLTILNAMVQR